MKPDFADLGVAAVAAEAWVGLEGEVELSGSGEFLWDFEFEDFIGKGAFEVGMDFGSVVGDEADFAAVVAAVKDADFVSGSFVEVTIDHAERRVVQGFGVVHPT